ncbi:hypothetical protein LLH00_14640 [bacterium]|nr:hypothetical protein [bacterium]
MSDISRKSFFRRSGAGLAGLGALGLGRAGTVDAAVPGDFTLPEPDYGGVDPCRGGWIAHTDWHIDSFPLLDNPVAFRKEITLEGRPTTGKVIVTAADVYVLYCNGAFASSGPARSWPREKYYDEVDLLPFLKPGRNSLAVLLFPCTGVNFLNPFTRMGLLVQGDIALDGGGKFLLDTDDTWLCRMADWVRFHHSLISLPTGFQEHFDSDREAPDWRTAPPSEGWTEALYLGSAGLPPWTGLRRKPIPDLLENALVPALVWSGHGSPERREDTASLAASFNAEKLTGKIESRPATDWIEATPGSVFTFDVGRTRLVRPGLEVRQGSGPLRLELYYDIRFEGRPSGFDGFGGSFLDTLSLSGGGCVWQAHRGRGLRYVSVKVTGAGSCEFRPRLLALDYPFAERASLEVKDSFIQALWDTSLNNIRSSTDDAYVDTCSRENLLWTMDAAATAKAAFYSFAELRMWRNCLSLIALGVDSQGNPAAVVPTDCPSPLMDQSMHWVVSCWEYYLAGGDISLLREVEAPLARFLGLCEHGLTAEDLYVPPGYSWHYVDWAVLDKRPYSLPVNALLLRAAQYAGRIAQALGSEPLAALAGRIGARLRPALGRFFSPEERAFLSRIEPRQPLRLPPSKPNSVNPKGPIPRANLHGNVLCIVTGCGTEAQRAQALEHACALLALPSGPENRLGLGYCDILLSPLLAAGRYAPVRNKLDQLYGDFVRSGQPTWGERAPVEAENTAHGWGAAVNSLIVEGLIGLKPQAPGWTKASCEPAAGFGADFAYRLETPAGRIEVERVKGKLVTRGKAFGS